MVASSSVLLWEEGYADGNVGGLLEAMLRPAGNFGKFLTVLLSLSVTGNMAASFYSISLNIQLVIPTLVVVPRYVFSFLATAMYASISFLQRRVGHDFFPLLAQCYPISDRGLSSVLRHSG